MYTKLLDIIKYIFKIYFYVKIRDYHKILFEGQQDKFDT